MITPKTRRESRSQDLGDQDLADAQPTEQSSGGRGHFGLPGLGVVIFVLLAALSCQHTYSESLETAVATVSRLHPVTGVDVAALGDSLKAEELRGRFVLFDVREQEEYETSHLSGAIRVDPDVKAEAFLERHGESLKGRTAVFYCSVGYRSSILVERLVAETGDSTRLVNLRGGIFRWYNEGLAVYDSTGVTDVVHPYSAVWGRLLELRM